MTDYMQSLCRIRDQGQTEKVSELATPLYVVYADCPFKD